MGHGDHPERVLHLVQKGALTSRRRAIKQALRFLAYAVLLAVAGVMFPAHLTPDLAVTGSGVFLLAAAFLAAGNRLGPVKELPGAIRRREISWVAHFPAKRGSRNVLLISTPSKRWNINLAIGEAEELLGLFARHTPDLRVEPYDGKRFRRWADNPNGS